MSDEVIKELWQIKDSIAREHGHDVRRLATYLQSRERAPRHRAVERPSKERASLPASADRAI